MQFKNGVTMIKIRNVMSEMPLKASEWARREKDSTPRSDIGDYEFAFLCGVYALRKAIIDAGNEEMDRIYVNEGKLSNWEAGQADGIGWVLDWLEEEVEE